MNKFDEFLAEMSLPAGFSPFDVMSVDEFIEKERVGGNTMRTEVKTKKSRTKFQKAFEGFMSEADTGDAEINPVDIDELMQKKLGTPSAGVDIAKRPEKMLHRSNIIDENGNLIDTEALKKKIMQRPASLIGQNAKLAKSGATSGKIFYDLTLPSYMGLFVDESTGEFKIVKTCPSAGECSKFCYAAKGGYIQYPASSLNASKVVNYLMNDPEGFKAQIEQELARVQKNATKNKKTVTLRWHDSGDFLSEKYLMMAYDVARNTPNVLHYAYTKQVPLIKKLEAVQPDNFVFNFSFGGIHDEEINQLVDKHSRVLPRNLFIDLPQKKTETGIEFTPAAIDILKTRAANTFNVKKESIITYDELLNTPVSTNKKWNVLVWKGHGDDAATRKDVLGTYLLFH